MLGERTRARIVELFMAVRRKLGVLLSSATILVLLGATAASCQNRQIVYIRDAHNYEATTDDVLEGNAIDADLTLRSYEDYATMCEFIYESCANPDGSHRAKYHDEYRSKEHIRELEGRWEPMRAPLTFPSCPKGKRATEGLVYDVWQRKEAGLDDVSVVVSFRGTDSDQAGDWSSNFRAVTHTKSTWDQYDQVRDLAPRLIELIESNVEGSYTLIATGHSLGGGLAQHFAYTCGVNDESKNVAAVVAFNSSPVTGATHWNEYGRRKAGSGLVIYRVYEKGEILANFRWLVRKAIGRRHRNPRIVEVRFNLVPGGMFSEHKMASLAAKLRSVRKRLKGLAPSIPVRD